MAASLESRIEKLEQAMGETQDRIVVVFNGDPEPPPGSRKIIHIKFVESKPHIHQQEQDSVIST